MTSLLAQPGALTLTKEATLAGEEHHGWGPLHTRSELGNDTG